MTRSTFDVGDYVIVARGRHLGEHGAIIDIDDPLDGGAPLCEIETSVGEIIVAMDRLEAMRRP